MRAILFVFLYITPFFTYSQAGEKIGKSALPNEIQKYYTNLSLINSLSTTSEKSSLVKYLVDGNNAKAPTSEREYFVTGLLKNVMGKELSMQSRMHNSFDNSRQVTSRIIYEISKWDISDEFIAVTVKTSQISVADNFKIIEYFDAEKSSDNDEITSLSTPSFLATEVHKWVLIDSYWYKKIVKVVLTN